jgi:hypothetical protein
MYFLGSMDCREPAVRVVKTGNLPIGIASPAFEGKLASPLF